MNTHTHILLFSHLNNCTVNYHTYTQYSLVLVLVFFSFCFYFIVNKMHLIRIINNFLEFKFESYL